MLIDAFASRRAFVDHLAPVFLALPPEARGRFDAPPGEAADRARNHGIDVTNKIPARTANPLMVASVRDERGNHRRPLIWIEHGAGQRYESTPYDDLERAGQAHRGVVLFLTPGPLLRPVWARYSAPIVEVGPISLDPLVGVPRPSGVIAVTGHWDQRTVPEARPAWPEYLDAIEALAKRYEVIGHGHPRAFKTMARLWRSIGVEPVEQFSDVVARAELLIGDNSSALPEWCALGRPVVWLNGSSYRRDVEHHGRFWDWPRGQVQVDEPDQLLEAVAVALEDPEPVRLARAAMVESIYGTIDGRAGERAAAAISAHFGLGSYSVSA